HGGRHQPASVVTGVHDLSVLYLYPGTETVGEAEGSGGVEGIEVFEPVGRGRVVLGDAQENGDLHQYERNRLRGDPRNRGNRRPMGWHSFSFSSGSGEIMPCRAIRRRYGNRSTFALEGSAIVGSRNVVRTVAGYQLGQPRKENTEMALWRRKPKSENEVAPPVDVETVDPVDIAPDDPLLPYLQEAARPVEVGKLDLVSPALDEMKAAGVELVVPLVTQGELVGILNLGPRLSERDYSTDDRKLLDSLASQAAPAVRVAQLVREQELEAQQ